MQTGHATGLSYPIRGGPISQAWHVAYLASRSRGLRHGLVSGLQESIVDTYILRHSNRLLSNV
jgi:hypothetical protein